MVDVVIKIQEYIQYWKGCREKTSSVYGLHFGHWKSASSSHDFAELRAMMTKIVFQSGNPLICLCKVLQVILQNISGNIKMESKRSMLLIEAYFNSVNKL